MTTPYDHELEELLLHLRASRGFDFTVYKRPTLGRRICRRMADVGVQTYPEYIDYLEVHPEEFNLLFNAILINVTSFFRDPQACEYVRTQVIPLILEAKPQESPIRVWSAGCSTGEEAYSAAMLLAEALSPYDFRDRVKVYATDIDEERSPPPAPAHTTSVRCARCARCARSQRSYAPSI